MFLVAILTGCESVQPSNSPALTIASPTEVGPSPTIGPAPFRSSEVSVADAAACPTTNGAPGPASISPDHFFGWGSSFGNGQLWVGGLWPDGVITADPRFIDHDGNVGMKFGWWHTEPGKLQITGRRVDATAPPAVADVPDGYGTTGFQASGVTFPTEGCWEITGTVGASSLTFVTFVIRVPTAPSPRPT
jgi:hypothetical protein